EKKIKFGRVQGEKFFKALNRDVKVEIDQNFPQVENQKFGRHDRRMEGLRAKAVFDAVLQLFDVLPHGGFEFGVVEEGRRMVKHHEKNPRESRQLKEFARFLVHGKVFFGIIHAPERGGAQKEDDFGPYEFDLAV